MTKQQLRVLKLLYKTNIEQPDIISKLTIVFDNEFIGSVAIQNGETGKKLERNMMKICSNNQQKLSETLNYLRNQNYITLKLNEERFSLNMYMWIGGISFSSKAIDLVNKKTDFLNVITFLLKHLWEFLLALLSGGVLVAFLNDQMKLF